MAISFNIAMYKIVLSDFVMGIDLLVAIVSASETLDEIEFCNTTKS